MAGCLDSILDISELLLCVNGDLIKSWAMKRRGGLVFRVGDIGVEMTGVRCAFGVDENRLNISIQRRTLD